MEQIVILNQDRDQVFSFNKRTDTFRTAMVKHNGVYCGVNLMLHGKPIGTFDTILDSMREVEQIMAYDYPYYVVGGFSEYDS